MVSTDEPSDPREELASLVAGLRARIAWHARAGAWGGRVGSAAGAGAGSGAGTGTETGTETATGSGTGTGTETATGSGTGTGTGTGGRRTLAQIREEMGDCRRCKLWKTRNKLVFGVGAEDAAVMFVGEAPGADEDRIGEPFVGRAGELLDKMIEAMGWTRQTVYIANTVKSRPPGNRNPEPDELAACTPFLHAQIAAIRPRVIVALGRPAANTLLNNDAPISALRGKWHDYRGIRVMPTFHPAFLLRQPDRKRDAWSDLKLVIAELDRLGIRPPHPPR